MSAITFSSGVIIPSTWLNDLNTIAYTYFGDGVNLSSPSKVKVSSLVVDGDVIFGIRRSSDNATLWQIGNSATNYPLLPSQDNGQSLGSATQRISSGFFGTSVVTPLVDSGSGNVNLSFKTAGAVGWLVDGTNNRALLPGNDNNIPIGAAGARVSAVFTPIIDSGTAGSFSIKLNNGETVADFIRAAGAVANRWTFQGGDSGNGGIAVFPTGGDTNISPTYSTRGTGNHNFSTNVGSPTTQFQILHTASATRNITVTGSNGGNPTINTTAGNLAITPNINLGQAVSKIVPGATSLSFRNNADNADNILINDNGNTTIRGTLTVSSGITGTLSAGTSAVQSPLALSTKTTQAHGLGVIPALVVTYIECLTAEQGYSIGDRVFVQYGITTNTGYGVEYDSTNVNILTGTTIMQVINKTTPSSIVNITAANWKIVVVPYKIA